MTDPANDPTGPPNEDADRQSTTAPDEETTEAPEGLPWEVNPAVEQPPGNYATLAEAEAAQKKDAPINEAGDPAPTRTSETVGDVKDEPEYEGE